MCKSKQIRDRAFGNFLFLIFLTFFIFFFLYFYIFLPLLLRLPTAFFTPSWTLKTFYIFLHIFLCIKLRYFFSLVSLGALPCRLITAKGKRSFKICLSIFHSLSLARVYFGLASRPCSATSLDAYNLHIIVKDCCCCCCCGWFEAKQSKLLYVTNCLSACYGNNNKLTYCPKRCTQRTPPPLCLSQPLPSLHRHNLLLKVLQSLLIATRCEI